MSGIKAKDGQIQKMSLAQWQSVIDVKPDRAYSLGLLAKWRPRMHRVGNNGPDHQYISSISRAGNIGQSNLFRGKAGVARH